MTIQRIPREEQMFVPAGAAMQRLPREEQMFVPAGAAMILPRCTGEVRAVRFSHEENRMQSINATEFNRRSR
jgi:hypothetical protein